ncbi:four helix bundle protein [bacterium]|nr:MAG: four helix bundle protein [bacterium]
MKQKFRNLDVWIKSIDFIESVYKITNNFPTKEAYGLTSQIQRAATSIALNIAEGSGSGSDIEFKRFLRIALRSSYEVVCALEIAKRLNYLKQDTFDNLTKQCDELSAMIYGLMKRLNANAEL